MSKEVIPDDDVIRDKLAKFYQWLDFGTGSFNLDDYAVLFQAGTFEKGKECEDFCRAVYLRGPVPGPRTEKETRYEA